MLFWLLKSDLAPPGVRHLAPPAGSTVGDPGGGLPDDLRGRGSQPPAAPSGRQRDKVLLQPHLPDRQVSVSRPAGGRRPDPRADRRPPRRDGAGVSKGRVKTGPAPLLRALRWLLSGNRPLCFSSAAW